MSKAKHLDKWRANLAKEEAVEENQRVTPLTP